MDKLWNIISKVKNFEELEVALRNFKNTNLSNLEDKATYKEQFFNILKKEKRTDKIVYYKLMRKKLDVMYTQYNKVFDRRAKRENIDYSPEERLKFILDNIEHYKELYELVEDDLSKKVLINILLYTLTFHLDLTNEILIASKKKGTQYFDEVIKLDENDVFVDCGAYNGDTCIEYIRHSGGKYKKIYGYEPDRKNYKQAQNILEKYDNIIFKLCGVGRLNEKLGFEPAGEGGRFDQKTSGEKIEIISLDEDIKESVSFIKMDIEGFELAALKGSAQHIKNDLPKMAICVYHKLEDLITIPSYICSLTDNYKYYLRHYTMGIWDTVLYCIPKEEENI